MCVVPSGRMGYKQYTLRVTMREIGASTLWPLYQPFVLASTVKNRYLDLEIDRTEMGKLCVAEHNARHLRLRLRRT